MAAEKQKSIRERYEDATWRWCTHGYDKAKQQRALDELVALAEEKLTSVAEEYLRYQHYASLFGHCTADHDAEPMTLQEQLRAEPVTAEKHYLRGLYYLRLYSRHGTFVDDYTVSEPTFSEHQKTSCGSWFFAAHHHFTYAEKEGHRDAAYRKSVLIGIYQSYMKPGRTHQVIKEEKKAERHDCLLAAITTEHPAALYDLVGLYASSQAQGSSGKALEYCYRSALLGYAPALQKIIFLMGTQKGGVEKAHLLFQDILLSGRFSPDFFARITQAYRALVTELEPGFTAGKLWVRTFPSRGHPELPHARELAKRMGTTSKMDVLKQIEQTLTDSPHLRALPPEVLRIMLAYVVNMAGFENALSYSATPHVAAAAALSARADAGVSAAAVAPASVELLEDNAEEALLKELAFSGVGEEGGEDGVGIESEEGAAPASSAEHHGPASRYYLDLLKERSRHPDPSPPRQ